MSLLREKFEIPLSMLSINFMNGKQNAGHDFSGSYDGVRYMFKRVLKEESKDKELKKCTNEDFLLRVFVYKDLFNFEKTKDEDKIHKDFPFTKDGIEEGLQFVENNINTFNN